MVETKEYLKAVVKCSLQAAETVSGELKDYFLKQAANQQSRLDELEKNEVVKPKRVRKGKTKKRSR